MIDTDDRLETAFHQLLGRTPTDQERLRLYRVKDALGLEPNDSLWLVLMALDHYTTLYEKIPQELAGASEPLRQLARAPEIVRALEKSTEAASRAGRLWMWITARAMAWGWMIGAGIGLAMGTAIGVIGLRDLWVDYEKWHLQTQITEMQKQRAAIGANYEALRRWSDRGLVIWDDAIVVKNANGATTGKTQEGGVGIWLE